jgi:hypothetical protein
MLRLSEQEKQEVVRFIEAGKPLTEKFRFLLFDDKREIIRVPLAPEAQEAFEGMGDAQLPLATYEEQWTGDYVFENE